MANIILPRAVDSVECSATETCLTVQSTPFCLDVPTGDFHDGVGTTGNAFTGDYTLADERKGNLYNGPIRKSPSALPMPRRRRAVMKVLPARRHRLARSRLGPRLVRPR
jgi:hypothetical protein